MRQSYRALSVVLMLAAIILSACGAGAVQNAGSKVEADIIVTGVIESIDGTQWIVNGQTFIVDQDALRDGPFAVGDRVKVEGDVRADGSVVVTRVEAPEADDPAAATTVPPSLLDDNSNDANSNTNVNASTDDDNSNDDNSNDANSNDDNSNDDLNGNDNSNDDDSGGNSNDDNSNDSGGDDHGNDDNSNGG